MFVFIWIILLAFCVDAGSTNSEWTYCHPWYPEYCLRLSEQEISAEAGLCAVIHCSFNVAWNFNPSSLVWFKCEPGRCGDSEIIFHSKNPYKVQSSFSGRVSLLEPALSQRNCGIIINDLRPSDSGEYMFRVNSGNSGFSFSSHKATISVKALQQKPTVLSPALTEGQSASLTCTAPGLCSGSEPTFTWTWRGAGEDNITQHINITTAITDQLTPVNHRHSSTLELMPSAELHGAELSCTVSYNHGNASTQDSVRINVTYLREPVITGDTGVVEGSTLSLNCSVDSFPAPNITLRRAGIYRNSTQTDPGSASLFISNVTLEDAGRYECTVEHELRSISAFVDVKVFLKPHILNSSGCVYNRHVLSCTCVSRASLVPTVTWPLLQHHSEYTLVTVVTGDTVNSSLVLRVSEHNRTAVQCVSSNRAGQVQESFTPSVSTDKADPSITSEKIMRVVSRAEVIIAFLAGFLLATVLCCVVIKCQGKRRSDVKECDMSETLEMVHSEEEPELNGLAVQATDANTEPGELHYASINFSAMTRKGPRDGVSREETKTEYAEIKREVVEQRQENGDTQDEIPEDKEEAAMMDDTKQSVSAEEQEEEAALYSNLEEVMANE